MTNMDMPQLQSTRKVYEIDKFRRPSLGHHYSMLSLTNLCSAVEKRKLIRHKYNFNISLMLTGRSTKKCPMGHGSYNFGRTFLGCHYFIQSFSDLCPGVLKTIFKYYQTIFSPCLSTRVLGGLINLFCSSILTFGLIVWVLIHQKTSKFVE